MGERVIVNPALSCGHCEFCLRGEQSTCVSFGIMGLSRSGTFAEQVAVPAGNCYPRPAHLSDEEAGVLALAYVTAWRMLMTRAQLKPGETVLIHGIGGGVALAALQFAKLIGAEVFVTSSSNDKLSRARELGADHTLNYEKENVVKWIEYETAGRGVDVAVDAVGAATWPLDSPACARAAGSFCAASRPARRRNRTCGLSTGISSRSWARRWARRRISARCSGR